MAGTKLHRHSGAQADLHPSRQLKLSETPAARKLLEQLNIPPPPALLTRGELSAVDDTRSPGLGTGRGTSHQPDTPMDPTEQSLPLPWSILHSDLGRPSGLPLTKASGWV